VLNKNLLIEFDFGEDFPLFYIVKAAADESGGKVSIDNGLYNHVVARIPGICQEDGCGEIMRSLIEMLEGSKQFCFDAKFYNFSWRVEDN
jgi:hypothetical protein